MSRRSIIGIVIVVLAVLAVFGFRQWSAGSQPATAELETAVVERGTMIAQVSASGTIEARRQAALMFKTPGQVAEVYVEAGDQVAVGDPLVKLDTSELELQVAQARAGLAAAQARLAQLKAGASSEDLAAGQAAVDSAQAQLDKLQAGSDEIDVQAARAALDSAQKSLNKVLAGPDQFEMDQAKRNVDQARNQLFAAQSQRDSICGRTGISTEEALARGVIPASSSECHQAKAQALIAQVNVDQAAAAYEKLKSPPDAAAVAAARAQVAQAQAQLQRLLEGASEAELAAAQAQVRQAEAQIQKLKAGASAEELDAAQAQVDQARAVLDQAELALKNATLVAPMAGTVATVGVTEGELVSAALPAVVLIDTSEFKIGLAIDETDIGKIQEGQPATITLDAFPGEELSGQVTEVSPAGTIQQGIVTYGVTVQPDPMEMPLRPGMTAGVDIVVARKDNTLMAPNRAVRTQEGKRVVLVPRGSETVPVEIEIGLRNDQFVEIKSGLAEGDRVITSVVPSNNPLEGGFFGGGGQ
ncbi:MAG: efflux RND transporter periplasmic adaptor subunit [Anaerolineae bacterium]